MWSSRVSHEGLLTLLHAPLSLQQLGDAASARNKDPEIVLGSPVSQDRKQLPPLSVKRKLPTGAMGESLANRPPFLEKVRESVARFTP